MDTTGFVAGGVALAAALAGSSSESDSEELSELESFFFTGNALTGDLATGVSSSELESSRTLNKILYYVESEKDCHYQNCCPLPLSS